MVEFIEKDISVGSIVQLDQNELHKIFTDRMNTHDCWTCSGEFGAKIFNMGYGLLIQSKEYDERFGDPILYYELLILEKNVLIKYDERLVVDEIGSITVSLRSLDNPVKKFWLMKGEFNQLVVKCIGEIEYD